MNAPSHLVRRDERLRRTHRARRIRRRIHPALALLVTALAALLQLLGGAPATAARAVARPAPAAPSYASPTPGTSTPAGSESRRTARPTSRATSTGVTWRLESSQRALENAGRAGEHRHPGPPATGAADPAARQPLEGTPACGPLDPSHHRVLPVGAGRSPPFTCGS